MNIELTLYYEEIINRAIASGMYVDSDEVISAALQLLEKALIREAKIKDLRQAIEEGENSGPSEPWDIEEVKREGRKLYAQRQQPAEQNTNTEIDSTTTDH